MKRITFAVVAVLVAGAVYEVIGGRRDRDHFRQIGRSVDVGARSLNIYCAGDGSPTVVFDSGRGLPGYSWILVQPPVAAMTRACWYDRAGLGWSDPGPSPRSSDVVAEDLHELLRLAGIPPPYVLVGHSMGGFNIRVYQRLYPVGVAGLVLVDARQEDMEARIPEMPRSLEALCPSCPRAPLALAAQTFGHFGVLRVWALGGSAPAGMTPDQWATLSSLMRRPGAAATGLREEAGRANDERMRASSDLGTLPLVVLTAGRAFTDSVRLAPGMRAQVQRQWIQLQKELAGQSTRGKHVIVPDSGHMIPYEKPEIVIAAVRDVVEAVRRDSQGDVTERTR